jgi:hypothetical protein
MGVQILDSLCDDEHIDCSNLLSSITGYHVSLSLSFYSIFIFCLVSAFSIDISCNSNLSQ